jgi:cytochrome c
MIRSTVLFLTLAWAGSALADAPVGNPERGRQVFQPCRTCHYPEKGFGNYNGPSLFAIFGRKAGTREGFKYYSDTLRNAGFVWTPELLDAWLANSGKMFPGTTMIFVGLPNAQDRADLIAYLQQFKD